MTSEKRAADALAAEAAGESVPAGNIARPVELRGPGGVGSVELLPPLDWAADVRDVLAEIAETYTSSEGQVQPSRLLYAVRGMISAEDQAVVDKIRPTTKCLFELLFSGSESPGESPASPGS